MEIPRHWRLKDQRYRLMGYKITHSDGSVEFEFPPKTKPKPEEIIIYNSSFFSPDNQVVHSVVVGQNQEQNDEG